MNLEMHTTFRVCRLSGCLLTQKKIDYSGGLPTNFEAFLMIEPPRTGGNNKHHFGEITTDAMGAQIPIAQIIVNKGADYLFPFKGNQGNTEKEVRDHFKIALRQVDLKKAKGWSSSQDHEIAHGRDTTRTVLCPTNLTSLVPEIQDHRPELKSLIMVETDTTIVSTGKERKKERHCYF